MASSTSKGSLGRLVSLVRFLVIRRHAVKWTGVGLLSMALAYAPTDNPQPLRPRSEAEESLGSSATSASALLSLGRFCSQCPSHSSSFSPRHKKPINSIDYSTQHPTVRPCIGIKRIAGASWIIPRHGTVVSGFSSLRGIFLSGKIPGPPAFPSISLPRSRATHILELSEDIWVSNIQQRFSS